VLPKNFTQLNNLIVIRALTHTKPRPRNKQKDCFLSGNLNLEQND